VEKEAYWLPKLKPHLTLPIPVPIAKGNPDEDYPFSWSINKWMEGDTLTHNNIANINEFALDLSEFLKELQSIDALEGPPGGEHNYYRGCPLTSFKFNEWTLSALDTLGNTIDRDKCLTIWNRAIATEWTKEPVWIHGDVAPGNLLVANGRLSAVIDFGIMAIGDPAADLAIAWTFFDATSREVFLKSIGLDKDTEDRARGWALWKALVTCIWEDKESEAVNQAMKVIDVLLNE
jgi:aminoglycoside phosphotransferase (APT) family kinase protein